MAQTTEFAKRTAQAIKAELARRDLTGLALVPVLGIGRNAVYARLRGEQPFDVAELALIVAFLGIEMETLMASTRLAPLGRAA